MWMAGITAINVSNHFTGAENFSDHLIAGVSLVGVLAASEALTKVNIMRNWNFPAYIAGAAIGAFSADAIVGEGYFEETNDQAAQIQIMNETQQSGTPIAISGDDVIFAPA